MTPSNGWIKLHRKLLEWEWYSDTNATRLFLHFLLAANHENKRFRGTVIARGQLICGRDELAKKLGLSVQSVRTALEKLKSTSEITSISTSEGTLITVTNYDCYQDSNQHNNHELTSNQPAINQQSTTTKELKNIRSKEIDMFTLQGENKTSSGEKKYNPEFELFYEKFPKTRKGSRENAYPAWKRAITKSTEKEIMDGLEAYIASDTVAKGYVKGAAAWLNDDGWKSDYSRKVITGKPEPRYTETKNNVRIV